MSFNILCNGGISKITQQGLLEIIPYKRRITFNIDIQLFNKQFHTKTKYESLKTWK